MHPGNGFQVQRNRRICSASSWGRVGKAGFGPFKQREYWDKPPWTLSNSLQRSIDFFRAVFNDKPCRVMRLARQKCPGVVVASDAQADPGTQPSMGYLLADAVTGCRRGGYSAVTAESLTAWGFSPKRLEDGGNPIAPCEAAAVAKAMLREAPSLRGRDRQHNDIAFFREGNRG